MSLKLKFTLMCGVVLPPCGVLSTPNCDKCKRRCICRSAAGVLGALAEGLEEERGGGRGDVEGLHLSPLRQGHQPVACRGHSGAQPFALAAEDDHGGTG